MKTFKQYLIEAIKSGNIVTVLYKDLLVIDNNMISAVLNIGRGLGSVETGLGEVFYYPKQRKFDLSNGHHRLIESMMRGEEKGRFIVTTILSMIDRPSKSKFRFDKNLQYKGLEKLDIKEYDLRNL